MRNKALPFFLALPLLIASGCEPDALTEPPVESPRLEMERAANGQHAADHRSSDLNRALAQIRRATTAFQDVEAAVDAGYVPVTECLTAADLGAPAELGAMGFHYGRLDLIDGTFDPLQPEILVYEPRGDGSLHLVAVEYLFVGSGAPEFEGVHFHEFPEPFADFALHAWIWLGNPNGTFADFNPNVTCPAD